MIRIERFGGISRTGYVRNLKLRKIAGILLKIAGICPILSEIRGFW